MNHPSEEDVRARMRLRERVDEGVREHGRPSLRTVLTGGRIPSEKEQRLRKQVEELEKMLEEYGGHGVEADLLRARKRLEDYLEERGER